MTQKEPKIYKDVGFAPKAPVFLPDDVYAQALESFVLACVDVVVIDSGDKTLYLAKRIARPGAGWWWMGGRMVAGEEPRQTAVRVFARETDFHIDPAKLSFVALQRNFFADRKQEPIDKGTDGICYVYAIELKDSERNAVAAHLDSKEYEASLGLVPFTKERIETEGVREQVRDVYEALFGGLAS